MGIRRIIQQQGRSIWPPLGNKNIKAVRYEESSHIWGLCNNYSINGGKKKPYEPYVELNNKKGGKKSSISWRNHLQSYPKKK